MGSTSASRAHLSIHSLVLSEREVCIPYEPVSGQSWAELRLELILNYHQQQQDTIFPTEPLFRTSIRKNVARMGVILSEAVSLSFDLPNFNNMCSAATPRPMGTFSFRQFSTTGELGTWGNTQSGTSLERRCQAPSNSRLGFLFMSRFLAGTSLQPCG